MNRKWLFVSFLALGISCILIVGVGGAQGPVPEDAMGTAFTYQGRLVKGGAALTCMCDMAFRLYDGITGKIQVGSSITTTVPVSESLFTVSLDFGNDAFNGEARWLKIAVRCPAGSGSYTTLEPLQALTPTPYALALPGLWTRQNGSSPNLIGGYHGNTIPPAIYGGTVGGGGHSNAPNRVRGDFATVSGGVGNLADRPFATVGGGVHNTADGDGATVAGGGWITVTAHYAAVGGGQYNVVGGDAASIGGGRYNEALSIYDTVAGGLTNRASGSSSTVGGGVQNQASGIASIVGGGELNSARWIHTTVGGGVDNSADGERATVSGGAHNRVDGFSATIGGGEHNIITATTSTIGGGAHNTITGDNATIGGGEYNIITSTTGTIGGGTHITVTGNFATVSGGAQNEASGNKSTIGGGQHNTASGGQSTIAGGYENQAGGYRSMIPGGSGNVAEGNYSFAAGRRARGYEVGCFVWGDSTEADVECNTADRWVVRANGGVYFYSSSDLSTGVYLATGSETWQQVSPSDRALKENLSPVDGRDVLARLVEVPIATWNYKAGDPAARHMSPMAQDFYAAFGLGEDDRHLSGLDTGGVSLAAIQGLHQLLEEKDAQITGQQQQIENLEARLAALEQTVTEARPDRLTVTYWPQGLLLLGGLGVVAGAAVLRRYRGGER